MLVAACRFDLRIPGVRSLKEKRHVVKSLTGSLRRSSTSSVAEVDHHDLWQRTAIGVSAVAGERYQLRQGHARGRAPRGAFPGVELIDATVAFHAPEDE